MTADAVICLTPLVLAIAGIILTALGLDEPRQ